MSDLEHRISAALGDEAVTSDTLSDLIQETDAAIIAADATAESERAKALDPTLSPDPKAAREAMQAAEFARDRLRTVLPRLQKRHERAASAERKAAWIERYDAIKVEHDAAVAELRNLYPKVVGELVDLLRRNRELDARVRVVMQAKPFPESGEPDDGRRLLPVECAARGVAGFKSPEFSLDRGLILPDFNEPGKRSWPPHEVPLGVLLAEQMKMRGYG